MNNIDSIINNIVLNAEKKYEDQDLLKESLIIIKIKNKFTHEERNYIINKYDNILKNFEQIYNKKIDYKLKIILSYAKKLIIKLKYKFNRPRPFDHSNPFRNCIKSIKVTSSNSKSYPSGHAFIYRLLYKYFSKIDPNNIFKYHTLYKLGCMSRIIGGVHYITDIKMGIHFADIFFSNIYIYL